MRRRLGIIHLIAAAAVTVIICIGTAPTIFAEAILSQRDLSSPGGWVSSSGPAVDCVTVTSTFKFRASGAGDKSYLWLAGLSTLKNEARLGLALTARISGSGFFSTTSLMLEGAKGLLPVGTAISRDDTAPWGEASCLKLNSLLEDLWLGFEPEHTYQATLAYDRKHGEVSLRLMDLTDDKVIYEGFFPVRSYDGSLYAGVGGWEVSDQGVKERDFFFEGSAHGTEAWDFSIQEVALGHNYMRIGQVGALQGGFYADIALPGESSHSGLVELYPGERVHLDIAQPVVELPGKFSFILTGDKGDVLVTETCYSKLPLNTDVELKDIPVGEYDGCIVYTEPGYRLLLAKRPVEVITGRLHATVEIPEERPWILNGPLKGEIVLSSEKPTAGLHLRLLAGTRGLAENDMGKGRSVVWEKIVEQMPAGELVIPFAYTPRQDEVPEKVDLEVLPVEEGLKIFTECHIARREFFVSPQGNDEWSGRRPEPNASRTDGPFATLERARDEIRKMKAEGSLPKGGITVWVRGGTYQLDRAFALVAIDSGTPDAPIVYRAYGNEKVSLLGGREIPVSMFQPVRDAAVLERIPSEARQHVLCIDLGALGMNNFGEFPIQFRIAPVLELFFNDKRMTLARWPNEGWATTKKIVERDLGIFEYEGDHPSRWRSVEEVWLHGYWAWDWYDESIKVKEIDAEKHHITLAAQPVYGLGYRWGDNPRRYYAFNLIEELDQPGEWYLDRISGILYFWPPASLADGKVMVSALQAPVIWIQGASYLTIQGITAEVCQGTGIRIDGGREDRLISCVVRHTGQEGIVVSGGEKHSVIGCDIYDIGTSGLILSGGDRPSLTPAGHEAINNHIHHFSVRQRTYAGAIHIGGVGNRVAHNLIHDGPHSAIFLGGNDHVIEFNEIHHVCLETNDCGAFYMGRNPSERGNILRYNFWHHVGSGNPSDHGINAIYFDDGAGGATVFGNVFYQCGTQDMGAVFVHGGHDNIVENNIFIECKRAIGATPWDDARWEGFLKEDLIRQRLLGEVDITKPPFITRYPELEGFMEPDGRPRQNKAIRNVVVNCEAFLRGNYDEVDNWITQGDPGFVDAARGNFQLRDDSVVFTKVPGFQPIPFEEIGLQKDRLGPESPAQAK